MPFYCTIVYPVFLAAEAAACIRCGRAAKRSVPGEIIRILGQPAAGREQETVHMAKGNAVVGQSGGPTSVINASMVGVVETAVSAQVNRIYGMRLEL